jgi:hypothetical protein
MQHPEKRPLKDASCRFFMAIAFPSYLGLLMEADRPWFLPWSIRLME